MMVAPEAPTKIDDTLVNDLHVDDESLPAPAHQMGDAHNIFAEFFQQNQIAGNSLNLNWSFAKVSFVYSLKLV